MPSIDHDSQTILFSASNPLRIVVLISGGGTTLANLIERIRDGRLRNVRIAGVISSRRDVRGVEIAQSAGLPLRIIRPRDFPNGDAFAAEMRTALIDLTPHLVLLAGYLVLLPVPPEFRGRILNVHPALLPDFGGPGMYGARVHRTVIAAGARESGCTVHLVDDHFDHGPIVAQSRTVVFTDDTPEALSDRVGALERELFPAVLQRIVDNGLAWLDQFAQVTGGHSNSLISGKSGSDNPANRAATSGNPATAAASKSYECRICNRRVNYEGRLPGLYPFCSSRCRWVDLGHWFKGRYSIDEDVPPEELPRDSPSE